MNMPYHREPLPTYKSYKNEKFEKGLNKAKAIRMLINDSSLKREDKLKLVALIKEEIERVRF